jgi:hypothetical protein
MTMAGESSDPIILRGGGRDIKVKFFEQKPFPVQVSPHLCQNFVISPIDFMKFAKSTEEIGHNGSAGILSG